MLDVGSNPVHLLVVDAHRGGHPDPVRSHKDELRLGRVSYWAAEPEDDAA